MDDMIQFQWLRSETDKLKGDIAEIGIFKGGSLEALCKTFPNKIVHGFDTFEGIPQEDKSIDWYKMGDLSCSIEKVRERLSNYDNFQLYKGIFPDTVKSVENKRFCLINIDVDIYTSTRDAIEFFYSRLVQGGYLMIYNDYGSLACPGATKAFDEFRKRIPEIAERHAYTVYIRKGLNLHK